MDDAAPPPPLIEPVLPMSSPMSSERPRRPRRWGGIAIVLIAFIAGIAAMFVAVTRFPTWIGLKQSEVTTPALPNGQQPMLVVPAKTAAILPAIDLAALSGREAQLAAKLADLEARSNALDRDATRASAYATRAEGLMIAFAARRALDRGLGLGYLEDQIRDRFGAVQPRAVAIILQAARTPVTIEDLRGGLDGIAPELVTGAASDGWLASFRREIGTLVVLHAAGTPSPLPVDRVARARRMIDAGQVEAALAEVARTPGAVRAERWTSAARRYVDARRALDVIETAAILSPGVDAAPPPAATQP